ncbi:MAG: M28 family metallopeptidase [Vicinamibacterales bacterium]
MPYERPRTTRLTVFWLSALIAVPSVSSVTGPSGDDVAADIRALASSATNEDRFSALTAMLRGRDLAFTVETFTLERPIGKESRRDGRNVVVTLAGDLDGGLVIGSHYDAVRLPDGSLSRGAVDNAASSVMLVRLADALRAEPRRARLRFVWFDMEEQGLVGSAEYTRRHAADRIDAMLNFDINGYGDTIVFGPAQRLDNAAIRRALVMTCGAEDIACVAFPQMPPGDDRSFADAGIPAISIATLPAVEAHQFWLLRAAGASSGLADGFAPRLARIIHSSEDTPERVDLESVATTLRFARSLVRALTPD